MVGDTPCALWRIPVPRCVLRMYSSCSTKDRMKRCAEPPKARAGATPAVVTNAGGIFFQFIIEIFQVGDFKKKNKKNPENKSWKFRVQDCQIHKGRTLLRSIPEPQT